MHVGVNALHLVPNETGGLEVYARRLLPALLEADPDLRLTVFASREGAPSLAAGERVEVVRVGVNARSRPRRVLAEQLLLRGAAKRAGVELLHNLFNTAPAAPGVPQVTTVHDLIWRTQLGADPLVLGQALLVPQAAHRSRRVIAVSQATKDDLVRGLRVDPERVDVAPNGPGRAPVRDLPDEASLRSRFDLGERPLVLTVSAKLAHKNIARLIEAVAGVEGDPVLVVPGYATALEEDLRSQADPERVRFTGWLDDATLDGLYAIASCFAFPSLAEGFGMPVLEAMERGAPVVCSDIPVLREVGGNAAFYFDPQDTGSVRDAVERMLADAPLRADMARAGRERARLFSWESAARATLESYRRTLASTRS